MTPQLFFHHPSGFLVGSGHLRQTVDRDLILRFHKVNGEEPCGQREFRVFKRGAGEIREHPFTMPAPVVIVVSSLVMTSGLSRAIRTENGLSPAQFP